MGNDAILSIMHEARLQFLRSHGYDEMNAGGCGLIMADVMIAYRGEAFYGDNLVVNIYAEELTAHSFDLLYQVSAMRNERQEPIAHAKTGMACFDYSTRQIMQMTDTLKTILTGGNTVAADR